MRVRDAVEADLGALADLLLIVQQMHVEAQPDTYRAMTHATAAELLAARLAEPGAYLRVAEAGTELQGYCSAVVRGGPHLPLLQPGEFLYLNELVVRPGSRRQGVGRALVADLRQFARDRGLPQIKLDVGEFNSAARAFFCSLGFDVVGARLSARTGEAQP